MKKNVFVVMLLSIFCLAASAQQGVLRGKVTDAKTGEELVGAAIVVDGTTMGTITNFMGEYEMPPLDGGTYTIRVQYVSYETKIVEGVVIKANQETILDFKLGTADMDLEEVKVVARANRESENMLLMEQKKAVIAAQAIGSQELSRKGVSDAQGAVTKLSGVNKQEGVKNVFVRGLGDRYNNTTLNGFPLPSEDPEYKNISLDFFSSDVIKTVGVNKVFSSNLTGDVGGAVINIESKELVGDGEFALNGSWGVNSATMGNDFLLTDGVSNIGYAKSTGAPQNSEEAKSSYSFNNSLNPSSQSARINQAYGFGGGYHLGEKLSFYVTGAYDVDYFYNEGVSRNTNTNGTLSQDYDYNKFIKSSNHQAMANLVYELSPLSTLTFNSMYIHTNRGYYGWFEGTGAVFNDTGADDDKGIMIRQQINDNTLFVNQLFGKLTLNDRLKADIGVAFNRVNGNEPDRRINRLYFSNSKLKYLGNAGTQQRFDSELTENDLNYRAGFTYDLNGEDKTIFDLNFGYTGRMVNRDFTADIFDHQVEALGIGQAYDYDGLNLNDFYNQQNLGVYFDVDMYIDTYSVKTYTHSGYANITYEWGQKWIVSGGFRIDLIDLLADYDVNRGQDVGPTLLKKTYMLPSFNAKYSMNDKNAFRLGISKSYTMPQANEIIPFEYQGENFVVKGNPDLEPSENFNIDLKWDFYLSNDEILTVTGFYKNIKKPISRVEVAAANNFLSFRNISDNATATGIELEFRKNIYKAVSEDKTNKLSFGLNGSYIYTNAKLPKDIKGFAPTNSESQLEGAAPLILNSDISYQLKKNDFSLSTSVVFNYSSDKVYTLGTAGFQNIIETGVPTMDLVIGANINKHWGAKFKAQNLLNPEYSLTREPNNGEDAIKLSSYKKGMVFSAGLTYNF